MKDLKGKTAFVAGGAAGMGLGMARAFAAEGMNVVVADVRAEALEQARGEFQSGADRLHTVRLDATDRADWLRAADEAESVFGRVHLLCNNVGGGAGLLRDASFDDWDWMLGVNLRSTINGVHTMLPRILAHGQGGHIVNTSSLAGLAPFHGGGVYSVMKFAVTGLTESLRAELAGRDVGVSVLCPGLTKSSGATSRLRAGQAGAPTSAVPAGGSPPANPMAVAMDPDEVGRKVVRGVNHNDLYILTHAEVRIFIDGYFEELLGAMPPPRPPPPPGGPARKYSVKFGEVYETARPEG